MPGETKAIYAADAATIPTATNTDTVAPGVTFSYEELPTIVKLFPIKFDDLLSPDMLRNCDLNSLVSAIEDFVPRSTLCTSFLNDCKQQIKSHFMKAPSLRPDGEKKPSLLSVSIPIQVVKVLETFYHYDEVEDVHSHDYIDASYLRTAEIEQLFSRSYSTFFKLLKMKKFDGAEDSGECSICLQDYDEKNDGDGISLSELPCTHVFHTRCIIRSLDAKSRCPICRYHFRVLPLQKSCASSSS